MPIRKGPKPMIDHEEEAQKKDMCCDGCMMLPAAVVSLTIFGMVFYLILLPYSFYGRSQDKYPGKIWYFGAMIISPIHLFFYVLTLIAVYKRWRFMVVPNILLQGSLVLFTIGFALYLGVEKKIDSTMIALAQEEPLNDAGRIIICVVYLIMKLWFFIILIKYFNYCVRKKNQADRQGVLNQQDQQWSERTEKRSTAFGESSLPSPTTISPDLTVENMTYM